MGKADKLTQGAKKTSTGLFAGMTPLAAREAAAPEKKVEVNTISEKKEEQAEVKETVVIEQPVAEKIVEEAAYEPEPKAVEAVPEQKAKENKAIDIVKAVEKRPEIKAETEDAVKDEKTAASEAKSASRYEKEKFLLLDIRGYRDYVEHMAKAANMSATKYIRSLIQADMDKNMDIYEAHKALEEMLKGRAGG
jgi:hypothetical protein